LGYHSCINHRAKIEQTKHLFYFYLTFFKVVSLDKISIQVYNCYYENKQSRKPRQETFQAQEWDAHRRKERIRYSERYR
jgi:hypothetical protein